MTQNTTNNSVSQTSISVCGTTKRDNQSVRDTSKEALLQHIRSGRYHAEYLKTFAVLQVYQPMTRLMLSKRSGFPINKITQYVKMLLHKDMIREDPNKRPCSISGRKAYYLLIAKEG